MRVAGANVSGRDRRLPADNLEVFPEARGYTVPALFLAHDAAAACWIVAHADVQLDL